VTRRHVEVVAGVDVGEVQRSLRDVRRRALPPVPSEIRFKVKRIAMSITELLPRAGALGAGSPDTYVLVRCATDYLPTAFEGYLNLPRDYADHCVVADGKTPLDLLSEQLDLLTAQINRIADRVNAVHSDKLIANGRFLSQKFGSRALDLDARRPDGDDAGRKVVSALPEPMTGSAFAQHARSVVAYHGERILAEIPTALRRIGLLLLVVAISIPAFLAALIVVLWHLGS
jgi:hypothetical protein